MFRSVVMLFLFNLRYTRHAYDTTCRVQEIVRYREIRHKIEHNFAAPPSPSNVHRSCMHHRQSSSNIVRNLATDTFPHTSFELAQGRPRTLVRVLYVSRSCSRGVKGGILLDIPKPFVFEKGSENRTAGPPNWSIS